MELIIITDLDGTLLDHGSYSYDPAKPALALIKNLKIPLVLASSKTTAEMRELHRALDLGDTPAIVENGAGLYVPSKEGSRDGGDYAKIRQALDACAPALRADFQGFGDLGPAEIAAVTGLDPAAAERANQRDFSEPGLWHGTPVAEKDFCAELAKSGIHARRGGRFLTLSLGRTKADAMAEVAAKLRAEKIVALGDAPNDIEMLEAADIGVVIRNDHGTDLPRLAGEDIGKIRRTQRPGPQGWNDAVIDILKELNIA